jgi:hypothetical protein
MRWFVLTSIGALATSFAARAFAAEQNFAAYTRTGEAYNAKLDRCDALASKRGTPPGKPGHGDFIRGCVGKYHLADIQTTVVDEKQWRSALHDHE